MNHNLLKSLNSFSVRQLGNQYIFSIPSDVTHVYLCSDAARPCEVYGPYVDDRRKLGLRVTKMEIFDSLSSSTVDIDDFLYEARGWYRPESDGGRWTNGRGVVPLTSSRPFGERRVLSFEIIDQLR